MSYDEFKETYHVGKKGDFVEHSHIDDAIVEGDFAGPVEARERASEAQLVPTRNAR